MLADKLLETLNAKNRGVDDDDDDDDDDGDDEDDDDDDDDEDSVISILVSKANAFAYG